MTVNRLIEELIEKAGKDKVLVQSDIEEYFDEGSDEYYEIEKTLSREGIDVLLDDDFDEEESEDFSLLNLEVESLEKEDISNVSSGFSHETSMVKVYLKEIGQIPLLTVDEERRLATIVSEGRVAKEQLELYKDGDLSLNEEDVAELENSLFKAQAAKDKIIEANFRLVVSIAKNYTYSSLSLLDLIQEGNMGLMRAVDKFEVERGFRFSTYAYNWIRQAITRAIADQGRTIRVPVHMYETINKLFREQRKLVQELGREPTTEEIAERMDITTDKVLEIRQIARHPIQLEAPINEDESSTLSDFISDTSNLNPHDNMMKEIVHQNLDRALETLTDREETVLRLRFGLFDGRTYTLEEIGNRLGVTRERIRQIEKKSIRKLRSQKNLKKLN